MFNKSILAAALLTVGAIAGGSAVSAAEIGVRHTYGTSNRQITNGQAWSVQGGFEQYSEESAGFALGVIADDFSSEGLSLQPVTLNASRGSVFGPGGSIVNEGDVIDDDRELTGVYSNPDQNAGARINNSEFDVDASSGAVGDARLAARVNGGDGDNNLTQNGGRQVIKGDNTVTQTAEAGAKGYAEQLYVSGGLSGTPTAVDGRLAISGSGYVRSASGFSAFAAGESYNFTGDSTQGFSELSTFSR